MTTPAYWEPKLNPVQKRSYESIADYILMYGEKGSGKSTGGIHALIRHCYDEEDALALVVAPQIRSGKEGVFYELQLALDVWQNGNKDKDGGRIDGGMGLQFTEPTLDPQTKDRTLYIYNRHGGKSKVILISIPYAESVEKRMKGLSPSFVYIDEITELEGKAYFTYVGNQLGRRKSIRGPQQYYASCNPEGPSNWVYEVFFVDCVDPETGKRDSKYDVFHIPVSENEHNLPAGYLDRLKRTIRDEIDRARLIEGRWVDRPAGDAIFKDYFRPDIHIRPTPGTEDYRSGGRLVPHRGFPIWVGYDPGPSNYCISFEQMIPVKDKNPIWIIFDELIYVGEHRPDFYIAQELLRRIDYWSSKVDGSCQFVHIADQSAFSHRRSDGNYDATRMRQLTNGRVTMRPFSPLESDSKGTVIARVQMMRAMFLNETLFISATCKRTAEAYRLLASEKQRPGVYDDLAGLKPRRSPYLHPFDSSSYPIYYSQMNQSVSVVNEASESSWSFRAGIG